MGGVWVPGQSLSTSFRLPWRFLHLSDFLKKNMASHMKRRHDDSTGTPALSEYHLRKESSYASRNASHPSQDSTGSADDRVNSPKNVLDTFRMYSSSPREHREPRESRDHSKRSLSFASKHKDEENDWEQDEDAEKRVTIWNWREQRKLSGNSAPFKKNLKEYIRKHPDWEEYVGQDKDVNGKKLSPKKMKPPAPMHPDHPSLNSPPASPCKSAYGTRSSRSERDSHSSSSKSNATPTEFVAPAFLFAPDLDKPMPIKLESPDVVAKRRALEVATRLHEMTCDEESEGDAPKLPANEQECAAAAWQAASEAVARANAEREAAERKAAEESEMTRRSEHSKEQLLIADTALARIQAFKRRRLK